MQAIDLLADFGKKFWPWILATVAVAIVIWAFLMGYRLGTDPIFYRNGAVVIENLPPRSNIYIDQVRRRATVDGTVAIHLSEGAHDVIVDSEANQPWNEIVSVSKGANTVVNPIFVAVKPHVQELPSEQATLLRSITSPTYTKEKPLLMKDGCVAVYVDNMNRIIAAPVDECEAPSFLCTNGACDPTVAFAATDKLRTVIKYKDRDDALIIAAGTGIYVVELDPHTPQFFAPLYKGLSPRIVSFQANSLTIIDKNQTFNLAL